ncbi:hypothetical protein HELRODRAFT_109555 [Helobdella robusta]|uniref:adenosylhomocysteinase n=1 Tax=Helobdella robusta TaxID=6412 RepID=T1EEU8_HELRO|nr:hypothetical protein HELRODRAFT_109555 [Helobdella robusta]ESO09228.1 hypothetical protein HELRODRAFT_109555 [Helobdella robusta]
MAEREMPGVLALRKLYEDEKPLQGARIVCCTHVNAQTAVVIETLIQLGAKVRWASCNIYSTQQNEVAAAVAHAGVSVYAWKGMQESDFWWCIDQCLEHDNWHPNLILDDGGDATDRLLNRFPSVFNGLKGVVEEGVSGIHRLHVLNKNDKLLAPAMRIDDAVVKCKFDTVYCCRETVVEVLKKAADVMFAGMKVLICGYGDVGKGCSLSLKSLGAQVFVTEVDPICALQACMEGYTVVQLEDVIDTVDCVITCTGNKHVLYGEHFNRMKSGCIVCNMGHPYMEVEIKTLKSINLTWQKVASLVDHVIWPDGKFIVLLSEGRLATLGNCKLPSLVASVTASTQILALIELFTAPPNLYEHDIYILPKKMDELVASLHLSKFNARLSVLTDEQSKYVGFDKKGPFKVKTYRY